MRVTTPDSAAAEDRRWPVRICAGVGALASLAIIFTLDKSTGMAPVQHLYYLPIVLAGAALGYAGGLSAAMTAIALYHFANPHLLTFRYQEMDVVQVGLFIGVGVLAAKLASDRRRIRALAMTDDLTGLHNLRSFEGRLAKLVMESERSRTFLALFVLDVDRLKSLNDAHGHLAGAAAVRTIGHVIRARMPGATACRYGGDEFVVAVPRCDRGRAVRLADDLRASVRAVSPILNGILFPQGTLSISIGVVCASPVGAVRDPMRVGESLFTQADRALYTAKASGRDRVHLVPPVPSAVLVVSSANRASHATHGQG
jgi:diguanylate cyclase (GGDEF)-like protein